MNTQLYLSGAAVGLGHLTNLEFDPVADYSGCKLCGAVFQSAQDRLYQSALIKSPELGMEADRLRAEWRLRHSKQHTEKEHRQLALSGEYYTPEAALRLAPFGHFPLSPGEEVSCGMFEAPRAPIDDCEGG